MSTSTVTLAQLVASFNELATAAGQPTRKSFDNKAKAEAAIKEMKKLAKKSGAQLKVASARKPAKAREAGPRGFSFGPVWLQSIRDAAGAAMQVANMPKLKATAEKHGVELTEDLTQAEMVKMIAKAI